MSSGVGICGRQWGRIMMLAGRTFRGRGSGGDLSGRLEKVLGDSSTPRGRGRWWWVAVAAVVLLVLSKSYVVIPAGTAGVVFSDITGVHGVALGEGFHPIVPFVQHVTRYDTKFQNYTMSHRTEEGDIYGDDSLQVLTSDGQKVLLDITVRFRIPPDTLPRLHREIGPTYRYRVVRPEARSVVRMVCAGYPVTDYTSEKRAQIEADIEAQLTELFSASYINLVDVIIAGVEFSPEFRSAVEEKQQALQAAEEMRYRIQESETEAERVVVAAEGDAGAIEERGAALERNPLLIQYEYVKKIAPNVGGLVLSPQDLQRGGSIAVPSVPGVPRAAEGGGR